MREKVFCKQTADWWLKEFLDRKIPAWNWIPYTQTHLFYIVTMSGKIGLQVDLISARCARWMLKDHYINIMHADYLCGMPDMLSWLCRSTLENLENNVTRFQKGWYNIEIVFMACWRKYSMFRRRLLDRPSRRNVYKVSDCKYYY